MTDEPLTTPQAELPQPDWLEDAMVLREWAQDVFVFAEETLRMLPAEPLDDLKGVQIPYVDAVGNKRSAMLFDKDGRLMFNDLSFYSVDMFKNQDPISFRQYQGTRFTWMQTVILTAYNRALHTFGRDSFDVAQRYITVRSGHGIGKTGAESVIALHFLLCYPGAQIGMTSNSEQQVEDIFMKELAKWRMRLPDDMQGSINQTADHVRIEESEDWFLRAQVARADKPEALAGLHGEYVLIIVDEASGVDNKVFEVMKGALTGDNYIVIYCSNPTRNDGEFFDSHKPTALTTKLHFSSRHSPIVKPGFIEKMEHDYPSNGGVPSDEVLIRVDGEFAGTAVMDDKGWIPLFANINILFEPQRFQILSHPIVGVDPAGQGKDRSIAAARDNVYLKEVLNEATSNEKDLARKIETIRDVYGSSSNDIGIDAFGIGAKVVAEIHTKVGESVNALLTDKPREGTEDQFVSFRDELAWKFRSWVAQGGIIITNNKAAWMKELEKIKFKRVRPGRIQLMSKREFKKEHGFSPDRFDAAIYTFFRDNPTQAVIVPKAELERIENQDFIRQAQSTQQGNDSVSSM